MSNNITKTEVLSSLIWKLMERGGTQGIQFIVTVVLARLLVPEEFGLIILATIVITIAKIFVETGFNTALIQKKEADEIDFSSVFYLSIMVAGLLYLCLFLSSPYIALFFNQPEFTNVLRILSLILFLGAINSIQIAIISRNLQFKKLFISSIGAVVLSGIVGIVMAYANFGIWALVGQQLTNQIVITIILWFTVKWRPLLVFSIARVKKLFSFGWKLLVSGILDTLTSNLTNLLVGKIYSPTALGFYNRGEQLPSLIVNNVDGSIQSVMLPTLSKYQENRQRVKEIARRSIVTSSFIIFPMMVGLAVIAEPLIEILFTEKWLPAVPFLQISCAVYALWPIHTMNLQVMNALGRSDLFLKLEIVKKALGIAILIISLQFGIYALVWGGFIGSVLSTFINAYPNRKLIQYSFAEQWRDLFPSLLLSLVMGVIVYTIHWFELYTLLTLIIQMVLGIIIYVGLAKILKLECYSYLITTIKDMMKNKKDHKELIVNSEVQ